MKAIKRVICVLLLPVLLIGCARQTSYEQAEQRYRSLKETANTMSEAEYSAAYAELFDSIAHGSVSEQNKLAGLTREILGENVVFENDEVFDIAGDYAMVYSKLASGDRDMGVQELKIKSTRGRTARLEFPYWGEMWYSVKMVSMGEDWVTGEFTNPYQGELGQYLLLVQFNDAEPSLKFAKQYPLGQDHKLRIPRLGPDREMTMHIISNSDHGYNVYIGSDEPFWVEEQSSVRLNRLVGTVSVEIHFGEQSD